MTKRILVWFATVVGVAVLGYAAFIVAANRGIDTSLLGEMSPMGAKRPSFSAAAVA
mgnify:CR=1 FL=1